MLLYSYKSSWARHTRWLKTWINHISISGNTRVLLPQLPVLFSPNKYDVICISRLVCLTSLWPIAKTLVVVLLGKVKSPLKGWKPFIVRQWAKLLSGVCGYWFVYVRVHWLMQYVIGDYEWHEHIIPHTSGFGKSNGRWEQDWVRSAPGACHVIQSVARLLLHNMKLVKWLFSTLWKE